MSKIGKILPILQMLIYEHRIDLPMALQFATIYFEKVLSRLWQNVNKIA